MHLITGKGSAPHVTAENDAIRNSQIYGNSNHIIKFRNSFSYSLENGTTIRIYDGYGIMNGRFFEIEKGKFEDIAIEAGTAGKKRADLIVARYTKNMSTDIESIALCVIKGEESDSYVVPQYNEGSIFDGLNIVDFPLYRINVNDQNISEVIRLFDFIEMGYEPRLNSIQESLSEEIENRENAISTEKEERTEAIIDAIDNCYKFYSRKTISVSTDSYFESLLNVPYNSDEIVVLITPTFTISQRPNTSMQYWLKIESVGYLFCCINGSNVSFDIIAMKRQ